jgi:two-component system sensor histidine kinase KdpD
LTRHFAEAGSRDEIVWQLIAQVFRVFQASAAVCLPVRDRIEPHPDSSLTLPEKELSVSDWAFRHRQAAGRFTDNLPGASALHLPLVTERKAFGVLAVALPHENLDLAQRELLEAFARQAAIVLDRIELRAAAEQTRLLAESERLGRALLNSISHELRTPLAASTSAASALAAAKDPSPEQQGMLLAEIQEANARLNRVVGNLLDVARLESGKVVPRLDWYDACDVVQTAIRDLARELASHPVTVDLPAEPMLARFDFTLLHHAIANLLVNASVHTPPGTPIQVQGRFVEDSLLVTVADRGPGIPPESLPRIFDKFYRGPNALAGGSGLGLTIARGFVEAHGGSITAANRPGGGATFTLRIPQPEVTPEVKSAA